LIESRFSEIISELSESFNEIKKTKQIIDSSIVTQNQSVIHILDNLNFSFTNSIKIISRLKRKRINKFSYAKIKSSTDDLVKLLSKAYIDISNMSTYLNSMGEQLIKTRYEFEMHNQEVKRQFVQMFKEKLTDFMDRTGQSIKNDLSDDYGYFTPIEDIWDSAKDKVSEIYESIFGNEENMNNSGSTLKEKIFHKYLSEEITKEEMDRIFSGCLEMTKQSWINYLNDYDFRMPDMTSSLGRSGQAQIDSEMSMATKTLLGGLTAITTSTFVLAAGWHTLAWSLSGLFLPALPVILVTTVLVSIAGKDMQLKKETDSVDLATKKLEQEILFEFLAKTLPKVENKFDEYVDKLIRESENMQLKDMEYEQIHVLENHLDDLGRCTYESLLLAERMSAYLDERLLNSEARKKRVKSYWPFWGRKLVE